MSKTIKQYVLDSLDEGDDLMSIWRDAQQAFPFKCVGLNYIANIARKRDAEVRRRDADRVDGYDRDDLGESQDY